MVACCFWSRPSWRQASATKPPERPCPCRNCLLLAHSGALVCSTIELLTSAMRSANVARVAVRDDALVGLRVQRASSAQQVAAAIREQLLLGEVAPGTR